MSDIFCTLYDRWKNEGKVVFENDHVYSILSVTPATPGHAIVIPKRHVEFPEELAGYELVDLMRARPATILSIQSIYESDPDQIVRFYQDLKENPPTPASRELAQRMLVDKDLRVKPEQSYNAGCNVGEYAGQIVNHFHEQLFPRRGRGPGIVTAMQNFFR